MTFLLEVVVYFPLSLAGTQDFNCENVASHIIKCKLTKIAFSWYLLNISAKCLIGQKHVDDFSPLQLILDFCSLPLKLSLLKFNLETWT